MVENVTEDVKVTPYVVAGNTIMFNAWITKNIAYKVAETAYVDKNGIPYILEVNTLPGMTPASLFPKSAAAINISYSGLLDKIIETSMKVKRSH